MVGVCKHKQPDMTHNKCYYVIVPTFWCVKRNISANSPLGHKPNQAQARPSTQLRVRLGFWEAWAC
jgi:hypothetical protein